MHAPIILKLAVFTPLRRYFDYILHDITALPHLKPGIRIRVPFHRRELIGVLISMHSSSTLPLKELKPIMAILDETPIFKEDIFHLCLWMKDYYHSAPGEVFSLALPTLLRQGKKALFSKKALKHPLKKCTHPLLLQDNLTLNQEQALALDRIKTSLTQFKVFLLDGITGSGKTEVYLQAIYHVLQQGKQVLVLVPEIGLTPQTINRFSARFNVAVVALHSGLTERERLDIFLYAEKGMLKIIIGTRSAIFTPFQNLGLIVIDEEHDLSFKQQEGIKYHARDLSIMRAHRLNIPIIIGSATPALDTLFKATQGKFHHLTLRTRAGDAKLPHYQIVDIRNQLLDQGLSHALIAEIKTHLSRGEQVMLFLNRRGYAPILMCHSCGWVIKCERCDIPMTYHREQQQRLFCHHCDAQKKYLTHCEGCHQLLNPVGLGTQRLEDVLEKNFKEYSIARIDRDTTRKKGALEKLLSEIQAGVHHIIVGTQMLAKGHHFPNVTLVAIVDADSGLFSHDFRGLERMAQLLVQVAGRAGRDEKQGKVIVQTHHPEHPLLTQLFKKDYHVFAERLLQERQSARLPPFSYLVLFRAEAYQIDEGMHFLEVIKSKLRRNLTDIEILGPIPAPMPRRQGRHRFQLLLQAKNRALLQNLLKNVIPEIDKIPKKHRVRWSIDVDPMEMF